MKKILFTSAAVAMLAVASYAQDAADESAAAEGAQVEFKQVEKCVDFVNGTADYDKTCIKSGLKEMKENTCYTLNPARGASPVWINDFASQDWWWVETDCFDTVAVEVVPEDTTSAPIADTTEVAPAREFTLTPKCIEYKHGVGGYTKNCYNSGLNRMEEGACYSFNPAKLVAFENEMYVNGTASDTAWWVKTDCFDTVNVEPVDTTKTDPIADPDTTTEIDENQDSTKQDSIPEVVEDPDSTKQDSIPEVVEDTTKQDTAVVEDTTKTEEKQYELVSKCTEFENGRGNYDLSCFNSGLLDMEEGKCYTMNKDRGESPIWINNNASQDWWWVETDCFDSVEVDPNAPVEPAKEFKLVEKCIEYVHGAGNYAKNCYNSGLNGMKENTCYALKSTIAKEYQYAKYINGNAFDKAWWVETNCFDTVYVDPADTTTTPDEPAVDTTTTPDEPAVDTTTTPDEPAVDTTTTPDEPAVDTTTTPDEPAVDTTTTPDEPAVDTTTTPAEPVNRCIEFVNGVDNYGSECFKAGLLNIEEGKCYTMNPDRAGQYYTYINNDASDSWWWKEVSCFAEEEAPKAAPKPFMPSISETVMGLDKRTLRVASTSASVKTLRVFDMNGKLLLSETINGKAQDIDLAKYAGKGVLLVRVSEGSKLVAMKRVAIR